MCEKKSQPKLFHFGKSFSAALEKLAAPNGSTNTSAKCMPNMLHINCINVVTVCVSNSAGDRK